MLICRCERPRLIISCQTCLEAVTQAFHDGGAIIEKIKKKRALKCAPQPPRLLEESIDQAPEEIEKERRRGVGRFGNTFVEGDHIAIITLQQITIQLQQSLLEKLRNAAFDDDTRITDFTYLVDAADLGRDRTIATLHELKQRLLSAEQAQNDAEAGVEILQSSTPPVTSPVAPSTPALDPLPVRVRTNSSLSAARTTTKDYTYSRDASGEEDAVSGAEADNPRTRQRKRSSLLHFLKHSRTHSGSEKDPIPHATAPVVQPPQIPEEGRPDSRASQTAEKGRSLEKSRNLSGASPTPTHSSLANAVVYRPPPSQNDPTFTYEEWEDNPQEIWGPSTANTTKPANERRDTINVAPDAPPSPVLTHRTNSGNGSHLPSTAVPTPNPSNDYLGFCKSASRLQNSDRKALTKTREVEPWSRHPSSSANALHFLSCVTKSCAFRSSFTHTDTEMIWNKLLPERKGVRARWKFLAKSHVPLRRAGSQSSYQCLFCVFQQGKSAVFHGADLYLEHIASEHRGTVLGDVILYKTGCVNDRVCSEDDLHWDINLYPISGTSPRAGIAATPGLSSNVGTEYGMPFNPEDYTSGGWRARMDDTKYDSVLGANEPWNEGLSDFHYRGELDRTELE